MREARGKRWALVVAGLVAVFGAFALPLAATTFVGVSDASLADQAELIVSVEVISVTPAVAERVISTRVVVRADEFIKGWEADPKLIVRLPGGRSRDDGRATWIPGMPTFRSGDRAVLFLRRSGDGSFRILHLMLGAFHEERRSDEAILVRAGGEAREIAPPGKSSSAGAAVRHRRRFESWLRDRVSGHHRPADYLLERQPITRPPEQAPFTLLSSQDRFRWFEFDDGREVQWVLHRKGQKGMKGKGFGLAKRALSAWNGSRTGTNVSFTYTGKTRSTTGFSELDGRNTIMFTDHNDLLGDDFDCEQGGVLAIGGLSWAVRSGRTWKGLPFLENVEGEVVVNDGVECLFKAYPSVALQVYTHELGHALGLGHSCGVFATNRFPECRSSRTLREATMRAVLHWPGRGARLAADDIAATRFVYDPEFIAAPCHLPPGHKRFCKLCGPCGEGQGNCRRDSQCAAGLECKKNVGGNFDLPPERNVCVPQGE